jgi:DNA invertase Pin-like site-specific DNA recombinase
MKRFPPQTTGLVGYARVSTLEQSLALQETALKKAGCLKIFTDVASGKRADRPGLEDVMKFLREGDTLVVWKLDRLGRSVQHLIEILDVLHGRGIGFRSLQENIHTESAAGRMFFQLIAVFAEFERELIRERTRAGLAIARAQGKLGGRPPVLNDKKVAQARALLQANPPTPFKDVCRTLNCSPRTLRRRLAEI